MRFLAPRPASVESVSGATAASRLCTLKHKDLLKKEVGASAAQGRRAGRLRRSGVRAARAARRGAAAAATAPPARRRRRVRARAQERRVTLWPKHRGVT
eukprot:SAG11_NODE_1099_length_5874_cov_17.109784_10_plen_99_part_00